jgi:predicted dithiol-disulfide oxidoreductase (DUF899 family)
MDTPNKVVPESEWVEARARFLAKEKEFTRLRDALSKERRELPWLAVTKPYVFEGPHGKATLPDLFDGRSQLVVYHFMFDPSWDAGCPICSFWADNFDGVVRHLAHRDVTMVAVSLAPYAKLAAYERRMGWNFRWFSSASSDFNYDFHVSFTSEELAAKKADYNFTTQDPRRSQREGISVLYKDAAGGVFRTYSTFARGLDLMNTAYNYLDLVPKGRDEGGRGPSWVRRHDEYER